MSDGSERAQATVEMALVMPLVVLMLLVALQVVAVMRDAVALTSAARAGARRAMVDPAPGSVRSAVTGETALVARRLGVSVAGGNTAGDEVTVTVTYRSPTDVPIVGAFVGDVDLEERFIVLRE